jgi:hypothetical protein
MSHKNRTDNPFDDIIFWLQLVSLDLSQIFYEDQRVKKKEYFEKANSKMKKSSLSGKDDVFQK